MRLTLWMNSERPWALCLATKIRFHSLIVTWFRMWLPSLERCRHCVFSLVVVFEEGTMAACNAFLSRDESKHGWHGFEGMTTIQLLAGRASLPFISEISMDILTARENQSTNHAVGHHTSNNKKKDSKRYAGSPPT